MRLTWGQAIAGGLTFAVVAGLLLLPGRLLGPDRPIDLAVPAAQGALSSVQAAPPLAIRHVYPAISKAPAVSTAPRRFTYVARPSTVLQASRARQMLKTHRSAVISQLAPTAPLVRARVLAAIAVKPSSMAKTIAALAASLSKK